MNFLREQDVVKSGLVKKWIHSSVLWSTGGDETVTVLTF